MPRISARRAIKPCTPISLREVTAATALCCDLNFNSSPAAVCNLVLREVKLVMDKYLDWSAGDEEGPGALNCDVVGLPGRLQCLDVDDLDGIAISIHEAVAWHKSPGCDPPSREGPKRVFPGCEKLTAFSLGGRYDHLIEAIRDPAMNRKHGS